jgi:simple sugar transport system substrate-binding protein/basic membrane protein A
MQERQTSRRRTARTRLAGLLGVAALSAGVLAVALSSSVAVAATRAHVAAAEPWANASTVGFITVGSNSDEGYNEAVYQAAMQVKKDLGIKVLTASNVPETQQVTTVMQQMVDQGAKIIFATSYGYQQYAYAFALAHPGVLVLHQGGTYTKKFPANLGTYFGEAYDPVSLGGMAAGAVTKSGKLGFVYAFPIPQTVDNIDAFELGAQKIDPKAKTYTVATSEWCDPLKQKTAASALISIGVDVITQHQDCQSTVIDAAKAAKVKVVGYHFDAEALDPTGWLTGSVWNWAPLYESIIKTARAGKFTGSIYNANFIGTFADHDNPLTLAPFGPSVPASVKPKILAFEKTLQSGGSIFKGPIYCANGKLLVPAGKIATPAAINQFTCFVKGVVSAA